MEELKKIIRDIPDFPKAGIVGENALVLAQLDLVRLARVEVGERQDQRRDHRDGREEHEADDEGGDVEEARGGFTVGEPAPAGLPRRNGGRHLAAGRADRAHLAARASPVAC